MPSREIPYIPEPTAVENGDLTLKPSGLWVINEKADSRDFNNVEKYERAAWDRFVQELERAELAGESVTLNPTDLLEMIKSLVDRELEERKSLKDTIEQRDSLEAILIGIKQDIEEALSGDVDDEAESKTAES